jgi:hypothetical protein
LENQVVWWILIIAGTLLLSLAIYFDDLLDTRDKDNLKQRQKNKRKRRKEKRKR